jgi:hypothetical protein
MARILDRLEAKRVQLAVTEAESQFEAGYYYRTPVATQPERPAEGDRGRRSRAERRSGARSLG